MISVDPMQRLSAREYLLRCSPEDRVGSARCTSVSEMDDSDMAAAAAAVALAKDAVETFANQVRFTQTTKTRRTGISNSAAKM